MEGERVEGTVLEWNPRGFGFIGLGDGRRAYVHHTQFGGGDLEVGEAVTAVVVQDRQHPDKWAAQDVQRVSGSRVQGVVASWNARGFGFVDLHDGRRAYVHASQFDGRNLVEGEEISCHVVEDQQNPGKWAAMDVQRTWIESPQTHWSPPVPVQPAVAAPPVVTYSAPVDYGSPANLQEERYEGTVVEWNERGFGFISLNDGRRVYMHSSSFGGGNMVAGITINCTLKEDPRNPGKLSAVDVQLGKVRAKPQAEVRPTPKQMDMVKTADYHVERQIRATASVANVGPAWNEVRVEGRVAEWNERGFGFIDLEDTRRAYVHASGCLDGDLCPGEVVSCVVEQNAKNPLKWAAKQVRKGAVGEDGVVTSWNSKGGFGFVALDGGRRAYIHASCLKGARELEEGQQLRVITKPDERNPGKLCVAEVRSELGVSEISDGGLGSVVGGGEIGDLAEIGGLQPTEGELDDNQSFVGNVTEWNPRGFGFVSLEDGRKAYVHHTVFGGGNLIVGELVGIKIAPDRRNPSKLMVTEISRDPDVASADDNEGPLEKRIRTA